MLILALIALFLIIAAALWCDHLEELNNPRQLVKKERKFRKFRFCFHKWEPIDFDVFQGKNYVECSKCNRIKPIIY